MFAVFGLWRNFYVNCTKYEENLYREEVFQTECYFSVIIIISTWGNLVKVDRTTSRRFRKAVNAD